MPDDHGFVGSFSLVFWLIILSYLFYMLDKCPATAALSSVFERPPREVRGGPMFSLKCLFVPFHRKTDLVGSEKQAPREGLERT